MKAFDIGMLPIVELHRLEGHPSFGTFGIWKINKSIFCVTLEPPDKENKPFESSIPSQQYIVYKRKHPKFGEVFEVMNVPGRTGIFIHSGCIVKDTQGCICLAEHFGKLKGDRAILNSGKTYKHFMEVMEGIKFFHLTIHENY